MNKNEIKKAHQIDLKPLQLSYRDLVHGEFYYTPDSLEGTGGKEHNIIQYDERVQVTKHFGHNPVFYKLSKS